MAVAISVNMLLFTDPVRRNFRMVLSDVLARFANSVWFNPRFSI